VTGETTTYAVTVTTGTPAGGGTDANVFLTLKGADAASPEFHLDGPGNNFERGSCNVFSIDAADVGELGSIVIRHDSTGLAPAWYVERVTVRNERTGALSTFLCNFWLDKGSGDGRISREVVPA
jgi:hypothetical protein